jgi:hypothetical protein
MKTRDSYHRVHNIPILATMGPTARASAPSDLKIPITVPFWSCEPSFETRVIIHGTTIAVAETGYGSYSLVAKFK